tara:strand:+ start:67 stop:549 length:483 start_codon:yes stop_codon:yes gene_type:complete
MTGYKHKGICTRAYWIDRTRPKYGSYNSTQEWTIVEVDNTEDENVIEDVYPWNVEGKMGEGKADMLKKLAEKFVDPAVEYVNMGIYGDWPVDWCKPKFTNEIVVSEYAKKRMVELESRRVDGGYLDTTEWGQEEWDAFERHERMHDQLSRATRGRKKSTG